MAKCMGGNDVVFFIASDRETSIQQTEDGVRGILLQVILILKTAMNLVIMAARIIGL